MTPSIDTHRPVHHIRRYYWSVGTSAKLRCLWCPALSGTLAGVMMELRHTWRSPSAKAILGLVPFVLFACFDPDANDEEKLCTSGLVGDEACPCTAEGLCGPGLACISNVCVTDPAAMTSGSTSTATSTSEATSGTGEAATGSTETPTSTSVGSETATTSEGTDTDLWEESSAEGAEETGSPQGPNLGAFRSGSRLVATVIDGGGDVIQFSSFYDSELETKCTFQTEADGELYCSPNQGFSIAYFTDAECSEQRLATPASTCSYFETGDYVRLPLPRVPASTCDSTSSLPLFRAGAPAETPPALFEYWDGTCRPATVNPDATYFTLEEVSLSTFVHGERREVTVDESAGLAVAYIDGADGSSLQVEVLHEGLPCAPVSADDMTVCVPYGGTLDGPATFYASDTCEAMQVVAADECGTGPRYATESHYEACEVSDVRVFSVGDAVTSPIFQGEDGGICQELTSDTSFRLLGEELDLAIFPSLEPWSRESARLRLLQTRIDEVYTLIWSEWYDTQLDVPCYNARGPDGSIRCVPLSSTGKTDYFTDEACTSPAYTGDECSLPFGVTLTSGWDPETRTCTQASEVVALAPHAGALYELNPDCIETPAVGVEGGRVYAVAEILAWDDLAEVVYRQER